MFSLDLDWKMKAKEFNGISWDMKKAKNHMNILFSLATYMD